MGALGRFQDEFAHALRDPSVDQGLAAQPGFAVYRNTVMKACLDALQANYPAVARLVGEKWFRAAAARYVRAAPPCAPMLLDYGAGFEAFLRDFAPAADMPYLAGVARLDRCWTQAHASADEPVLDAAALAGIDADAIGELALRPHAAARWAWFDDAPVYSIWSRNRAEDADGVDVEWGAEGALLTRPGDAVRWLALDAAGCAFLDACAAGEPLAAAAEAALAQDEGADLSALMQKLVEAGAFAGPASTEESP